jgi:ABC-type dipeptide/oligopeptide/nickel transport system ATPase component
LIADFLLSAALSIDYPGRRHALRDAVVEIREGEILGLVGQSGSGKSSFALATMGLLGGKGACVRGAVHFRGRDLLTLNEAGMRRVRGREIALVPQSPLASLNPCLRVGAQLKEAWRAHGRGAEPDWMELLASVQLPAERSFLRLQPSQLSVGIAQRVLIAMAVIHRPYLLIADEPTSALDVITQREILDLFARLSRELRMAILFISHDLACVASLCHRVAILRAGEVVEQGSTVRVFSDPCHPYTRALVAALPRLPAQSSDCEQHALPR